MAQIKLFNSSLYSVAIDSDGDNPLDIPSIRSLPADQSLKFNGPFPNTYLFNSAGPNFDEYNKSIIPALLRFSNIAGASKIKFSETGDITVILTVKARPHLDL